MTKFVQKTHFFQYLCIPLLLLLITSFVRFSQAQQIGRDEGVAKRRLLGFKEKRGGGSNTTFDCSPSGPCVPCQYSEKSDDKYRCSETGYRIPFKCVKIGDVKKEGGGKGPENGRSTVGGSSTTNDPAVKHRRLADIASGQEVEPLEYVTYRSCIQGVNEEKLSVVGFEVLMLGLLLITGSFVIFRRKKTVAMAGAGGVRVQGNSRF